MSNWHSMDVDQVLKELNTDPHQGLSVEEARCRLEKYGYNEVKMKEPKVSPSRAFINKLKNVLVIFLLIVTVLSLLMGSIFRKAIDEYLISVARMIGLTT